MIWSPTITSALFTKVGKKWLEKVVLFTLSGLKRGEKGIYITDTRCTDEVKAAFKKAGADIDKYENSTGFNSQWRQLSFAGSSG